MFLHDNQSTEVSIALFAHLPYWLLLLDGCCTSEKASWHSSFFPSLARFDRIINSLLTKTRSTGVDIAGTDKILSRSGCKERGNEGSPVLQC